MSAISSQKDLASERASCRLAGSASNTREAIPVRMSSGLTHTFALFKFSAQATNLASGRHRVRCSVPESISCCKRFGITANTAHRYRRPPVHPVRHPSPTRPWTPSLNPGGERRAVSINSRSWLAFRACFGNSSFRGESRAETSRRCLLSGWP